MEINIVKENLVNNIGAVWMMETQSTDPTPVPEGLLVQAINEANARLTSILSRFTISVLQDALDDSLSNPDVYCYSLSISPRRAAGKEQAFTDIIHSYLVNSVLAKATTQHNLTELGAKHEQMAVSDAQTLNLLLRTKQPPII